MPLVSVIIATYNMAQYLGEAIRSVLDQTVGDLDVHVVDDGSTDDTRQVVERFRSDPRVHYHWQANAGQTRAKNVGIQRSSGTYVAFCDADDLWLPDKLERQLPLFDAESRVGVVYSRNRQILASGEPTGREQEGPFFSGWVTSELFKRNFISFGTAVIRRRCLEELGGFDEQYRMGIDWELWLRISTRYEIRFLDAVTYLYRVWPGQMSTNWRGRYDSALRIMSNFLEVHPGQLPPRIVKEAYAHTFTERARLRSLQDCEYWAGMRDAWQALRYMPTYVPAWKVMMRILATAGGWPLPRYRRAG